MPEISPEHETRSRQEQILNLASEGLTDKEIAARLKLSPETVGTYWRRILSKYAAASRTEVVAKVIRLQSEAELGHLTQVSEGLKEVADHLLNVLEGQGGSSQTPDANSDEPARILAAMRDIVVSLDNQGFVAYVNHPGAVRLEVGEPFEWSVDERSRDGLREAVTVVFETGEPTAIRIGVIDGDTTLQCIAEISKKFPDGAVIVLRKEDTYR